MTQVVVLEFDEALRGVLHQMLTECDHYDVTEVTTVVEAVAELATARDDRTPGMVVICSNQDADHHLTAAFFATVAADERLRTQHQYVMLSTSPDRMPNELRTHLAEIAAPVLPKPFEMDALLASVSEAAARLAPNRASINVKDTASPPRTDRETRNRGG